MARKVSRNYLTLGVIILLAAALSYAFWPRLLAVEIGEVARGPMRLTIDEEGRTRVHDPYLVSTPVAGRLLRVTVEPGDPVVAGESVVAVMLPATPAALDRRSRNQADAEVSAAEAALRLARAERDRAAADRNLAEIELDRTRRLHDSNLESQATLDREIRQAKSAEAGLRTATAAIELRQAELVSARARLIRYAGQESAGAESADAINLYAPSSGRVLRILQQSEATLPAGAAVLEIGNVEDDLEVLVELLSSDAVQVAPGDKVMFNGWGGSMVLNGVVERIEPWGFTKVSALGVEEQRVNTIIGFTDPPAAWQKLGHGFRVEAQIVVWEDADALIVPSSALFRNGDDWRVYVVKGGGANLRAVEIGRNNGVAAQVLRGVDAGERVILYPAAELAEGARVIQRQLQR